MKTRSNTITRRLAKQIAAKWRHFYAERSDTRKERIMREIDRLYSRLSGEKERMTVNTVNEKGQR